MSETDRLKNQLANLLHDVEDEDAKKDALPPVEKKVPDKDKNALKRDLKPMDNVPLMGVNDYNTENLATFVVNGEIVDEVMEDDFV
jgi:hypothetical protein